VKGLNSGANVVGLITESEDEPSLISDRRGEHWPELRPRSRPGGKIGPTVGAANMFTFGLTADRVRGEGRRNGIGWLPVTRRIVGRLDLFTYNEFGR
jgi:hypothetical protein